MQIARLVSSADQVYIFKNTHLRSTPVKNNTVMSKDCNLTTVWQLSTLRALKDREHYQLMGTGNQRGAGQVRVLGKHKLLHKGM